MRAYGRMSAKEMNERATMLLTSLGPSAEQAASGPISFPAVQRQRVALAAGRLPPARIIVADEPTGNLDHRFDGAGIRHIAPISRQRHKQSWSSPTMRHWLRERNRRIHIVDGKIHEMSFGVDRKPRSRLRPARYSVGRDSLRRATDRKPGYGLVHPAPGLATAEHAAKGTALTRRLSEPFNAIVES